MTTDTDRALPLLDSADERIADAQLLDTALRELTLRINGDRIDAASRADLGGDMLAAAERLTAFALAVIG